MALMDICDKITESVDNYNYCTGIFIDLSKAFDSIDHEIVINKLKLPLPMGEACVTYMCYMHLGPTWVNAIQPSMFGGPAKIAEPITMPFGMWTLVGPRNHVLDGGPDRPMPRGNF